MAKTWSLIKYVTGSSNKPWTTPRGNSTRPPPPARRGVYLSKQRREKCVTDNQARGMRIDHPFVRPIYLVECVMFTIRDPFRDLGIFLHVYLAENWTVHGFVVGLSVHRTRVTSVSRSSETGDTWWVISSKLQCWMLSFGDKSRFPHREVGGWFHGNTIQLTPVRIKPKLFWVTQYTSLKRT